MNDIARLVIFMGVVRPFPKTGVLINLFESCHLVQAFDNDTWQEHKLYPLYISHSVASMAFL